MYCRNCRGSSVRLPKRNPSLDHLKVVRKTLTLSCEGNALFTFSPSSTLHDVVDCVTQRCAKSDQLLLLSLWGGGWLGSFGMIGDKSLLFISRLVCGRYCGVCWGCFLLFLSRCRRKRESKPPLSVIEHVQDLFIPTHSHYHHPRPRNIPAGAREQSQERQSF